MATDKTYRIKPLVWEQHGDSVFSCPDDDFVYVEIFPMDGGIHWNMWLNSRMWQSNEEAFASIDAAKLAAESAYRALLMEALEEVA